MTIDLERELEHHSLLALLLAYLHNHTLGRAVVV